MLFYREKDVDKILRYSLGKAEIFCFMRLAKRPIYSRRVRDWLRASTWFRASNPILIIATALIFMGGIFAFTTLASDDGGGILDFLIPSPPTCTSWTYSDWSSCSIDSLRTRTILSSSPDGCTGGQPDVLAEFCSPEPTTCTDWTYADWSACTADGQQTRSIISSSPDGCTGGQPALAQSCDFTPSADATSTGDSGTSTPPTCASWVYSDWGSCASDNQQTRNILSSSPSGCSGGNPVLSKTCVYSAPASASSLCTSWTYSDWSVCSIDSLQTRSIISSSPPGCSGGEPDALTQSCSPEPPTCTSWTYSDWGDCSADSKQTRKIVSASPVGCSGGKPEPVTQSCTPTCTYEYSDWGKCTIDDLQTRIVISTSPAGCAGEPDSLSRFCTPDLPTCTSWKYSDWGECSPEGKQTRNILSFYPQNCTGGDHEDLTRSCTPTCSDWSYTNWTECSVDGKQSRKVVSSLPVGCQGGKPGDLIQSCTPTCTWNYSDWSICSTNGEQTRTIIGTSTPDGCAGGEPQPLVKSCVPICIGWVYSPWSNCGSNNHQTRTIMTSFPGGCTGGNPILSRICVENPPADNSSNNGAANSCTAVTYKSWSPCVGGVQRRDILSQTPDNSCSPTLSQQLDTFRPCTSP